jgi:glycosyltransferase involved in cell wall biosynthesis
VSIEPVLEFLLPGDPATLTGGYLYDRLILERLRDQGWDSTVHALDASFPSPTHAALGQAAAVLDTIPSGRIVVIDGLALGGLGPLLARHADRLRLVALLHHPLAMETGLSGDDQERLKAAERLSLAAVAMTIVTSRWTLAQVAAAGFPVDRIRVVEPGTHPAPLARGSGSEARNLLCVATVTPRKGHAVLVDALSRIRDRPWHLHCIGSLRRDAATTIALRQQIDQLGLTERIELLGERSHDDLDRFYHEADLFVLASYLEGYGMVLTEALARGLPVVSTDGGAIPATLPADAGRLVPVGDSGALADVLADLMDRPAALAALAAGARRARAQLPTWDQAAARFAAVLGDLA